MADIFLVNSGIIYGTSFSTVPVANADFSMQTFETGLKFFILIN